MAPTGQSIAQEERQALCDLLSELGPDAPTLCAGWRSADLAGHLLVRDRRPDAIPGMTLKLKPFQNWTARLQDGLRDTLTWEDLVSHVRTGPPRPMRPLDRWINTIEYFVHHEDLRRAQLGWQPRELSSLEETALWRSLGYTKYGPMLMSALPRYTPPAVRLEAPGQGPILLSNRRAGPVVRGPVGEVVMWVLGRKAAAQVEVEVEKAS